MSETTPCSRCGNPIAKHWSSAWPIACRIVVGRAAQTFSVIAGDDDDAWTRMSSHPAVVRGRAQDVVVEWCNDWRVPESWAGRRARATGDRGTASGTIDGAVLGGARYVVPFLEATEIGPDWRPPRWPLCFECHDAFLALLGEFLGLRKAP